ncbi:alpha/beta fold hydrolase, partial [Nostoc sp. NIES-2111]
MHASSQKPPRVILLHGTFAGYPAPAGETPRWWQEGSPFRGALATATGADVTAFCWGKGGANSETLRRQGARDLLEMIDGLEAEGRDYHLVGHSHGGSVIWQALVYAAARRSSGRQSLRGLRSWTTIGTPFQDFVPAHVELVGALIAAALVLAWLVICVFAWGTLAIDWDNARIVARHAAPWRYEGMSVLIGRALGLDLGEIFFRLILSAFVSFAVVAVALGALGLLQPLRYRAGGRAAPAPPTPPSVRVTIAAALGWFVFAVLLFLVAGEAIKAVALAVATLGSLLLSILAAWFSWTTAFGWWRSRQRRAEVEAARAYGDLWQPIFHPEDEAIAALRCALLPAPS